MYKFAVIVESIATEIEQVIDRIADFGSVSCKDKGGSMAVSCHGGQML
jgi:phage gp45-like